MKKELTVYAIGFISLIGTIIVSSMIIKHYHPSVPNDLFLILTFGFMGFIGMMGKVMEPVFFLPADLIMWLIAMATTSFRDQEFVGWKGWRKNIE